MHEARRNPVACLKKFAGYYFRVFIEGSPKRFGRGIIKVVL